MEIEAVRLQVKFNGPLHQFAVRALDGTIDWCSNFTAGDFNLWGVDQVDIPWLGGKHHIWINPPKKKVTEFFDQNGNQMSDFDMQWMMSERNYTFPIEVSGEVIFTQYPIPTMVIVARQIKIAA